MSATPWTEQAILLGGVSATDSRRSDFGEILSGAPLLRSEDSEDLPQESRSGSSSMLGLSVEYEETDGKTPGRLRRLWNVIYARTYLNMARRWQSAKRLHGWRAGVLAGVFTALFVLVVNIVLLIIGLVSGYSSGVAQLAHGTPAKVANFNTAYHTLINILSTLLLCASNYAMQVLSAPTRSEADAAHARGSWVEIGLLSPRNLRVIGRKRKLFWWLLGLSSVPLHLFYNSAIFPVLRASQYNVLFMQNGTPNHIELQRATNTSEARHGLVGSLMNNSEWQTTHASLYTSELGDLYLIYDQVAFSPNVANASYAAGTTPLPSTNSSLLVNQFWDSLDFNNFWDSSGTQPQSSSSTWLSNADVPDVAAISNPETPSAINIAWAYSIRLEDDNELQISLLFMLVVMIFNIVKVITMYLVYRDCQDEHLITVGDAVSSYLQRPEPLSKGYCALSKQQLLLRLGLWAPKGFDQEELESLKVMPELKGVWTASKKRYISSISSNRGALGVAFFMVLISAMIFVLAMGDGIGYWGSASSTIIAFSRSTFDTKGTLFNAWLANVPQLLLSVSYLFFNGLCTAMASAREWNSFATSKKGFRVSQPRGDQRSTYFLQLPYKFSLPLAAASGFMHWLLSQSFFLVRQDYKSQDGVLMEDQSKSGCGMSTLSLLILLVVYIMLFLVYTVASLLQMRVRVPFAASCSLVFSAACHPPSDDVNVHLRPVQWGVVEEKNEDGTAHCSITSQSVTSPTPRTLYA